MVLNGDEPLPLAIVTFSLRIPLLDDPLQHLVLEMLLTDKADFATLLDMNRSFE